MYNSLYNNYNYLSINQLNKLTAMHYTSLGIQAFFMSNYFLYKSLRYSLIN